MGPDDIPLFAMLKSRLGYLNERQKVVAQNVANADTPGYQPRDLKAYTFQASLDAQATGSSYRGGGAAPVGPVKMLATSSGHMAPATTATPWRSPTGADSETTLDGNSVSLEDQMLKMTDARMNYDAAVSFYQRSLAMLRTASRKPNG
ncbi:flagellar biosynthesis protein FlgB [Caulobacter sp. D4A]|uniref:flagellar basal body rod protein FlgB n=1 Tax=unclassified Caulobacter TaxID=2648921 RepID=UPI000D72764D|nr:MULTISPECIES: flagellar basal body rod protein FlgB [unclassified Caulobacter]PXA82891.1 flagellar biosynthesis protein FlgB [Caulobacter sp. D4A]PXA88786.1 flagellar biosynthesis protein FlgB [Caulobacter sp. D5]